MTGTRRVVSLVPSVTETLLALGADVVACTRFCNQPHILAVGGTKNPDVAAVVALRPDCVMVDTEENRKEDADALLAAGLEVLVTSVRSIDDALDVVGRLAVAAGAPAPPPPVLGNAELAARRTAFVPIWRRPWMTIGRSTYGASMLRSIGVDVVGVAAGGDGGDSAVDYPTVELAAVAERAPDLVLVPSEPYSFHDDHLAELAVAVPEARLVRVDGEDLFWWGIRTPAAQRRLAAALTP